jgi:hypothetical protein
MVNPTTFQVATAAPGSHRRDKVGASQADKLGVGDLSNPHEAIPGEGQDNEISRFSYIKEQYPSSASCKEKCDPLGLPKLELTGTQTGRDRPSIASVAAPAMLIKHWLLAVQE